jgi:cyclopropane fatty-acyl-phospholipid synthase-like methyltransferase
MTYSAARFDSPSEPLEAAQTRKYADLARAMDLKPGMRVLEIGCGWGGFAEYAAGDIGATVTGAVALDAEGPASFPEVTAELLASELRVGALELAPLAADVTLETPMN